MKEIQLDGLAALLEQTCRLIHANQFEAGLYPAQWAALRFFASARPRDRTIAALARFQGLSIAPVARTAQTLAEKGFVDRVANPYNKRADQFLITKKGEALIREDPRRRLIGVLANLSEDQKVVLVSALRVTVEGMLMVVPSAVQTVEPEPAAEETAGQARDGEEASAGRGT